MSSWVSSTLFFVEDVDVAIGFYVDQLGFDLDMRFEDNGQALVAGVSRGEACSLLLTCQWPDKVGGGVLYLALPVNEFLELLEELKARKVTISEEWWGDSIVVVQDPSGNQLFFARPRTLAAPD